MATFFSAFFLGVIGFGTKLYRPNGLQIASFNERKKFVFACECFEGRVRVNFFKVLNLVDFVFGLKGFC